MTPPQSIADKLSEAQKRAVILADENFRTAKEIGANGRTLQTICWFWPKGADPCSPCEHLAERDVDDNPLRYIYRLTPLGLSVRNLLQEQVKP